jgi:mono/diheme cytochrome c family protein
MPWFLRIVLGLAIVFAAIQVLPYGRDHDNPRSVSEPAWNEPETRALAQGACFDCHSNLTAWPWYTQVAPVSWLTARDVTDGRAKLNFSEWQRPQEVNLQEVLEVIRSDAMPPWYYGLTHREARLSDAERDALQRGLVETWSTSPPAGAPRG